MEEWFGLAPTGRQFREPTGVQHELVDTSGLRYTAIVFDPAWHGHPALTRDVELVRSFLEYPMVVGLVELCHADPARGVFVYPTGTVWTVKELLRIHSDLGQAIGPRAALELCWLTGQVLLEAAENGGMQGCFSHGGLTPWRIALRADGDLQVLGYGLPQVDVIAARTQGGSGRLAQAPAFLQPRSSASGPEPSTSPGVGAFADHDSLRYAPPERLTGVGEDPSADTLALTLIAFEVLTGRPLYNATDPGELHRAVSMSEGVSVLSRPNALPRDIAQVFARALVFDPDSRLGGKAWLAEIEHLLEIHGDGEPLDAVVDRVRGAYRDGSGRGAKLRQAPTESFTPARLKEAVEHSEELDPAPKPEQRWAKAGRRRGGSSLPSAPTPPRDAIVRPAPSTSDDVPRRRRRRSPDGSDADGAASPPDSTTGRIPSTEPASGPVAFQDLELELDEDDELEVELEVEPEVPAPRRLRRSEEPPPAVAEPLRRRRRGE